MTLPYVLLVDDSTAIQKVVRIAFARYELEIEARAKLIELEAALSKRLPQVVILDAGLLDSEEAIEQIQRIRKKFSTKDLRIVLLKSQHDQLDDAELEAIQCQRIVGKPFETREIVEAVLAFVEARRIEIDAPTKQVASTAPAENSDSGTATLPPPPPVKPAATEGSRAAMPESMKGPVELPTPPLPPLAAGGLGGDEPRADADEPKGERDGISAQDGSADPEAGFAGLPPQVGEVEAQTERAYREETIAEVSRRLEERKDDFETTDEVNLSALLSNVPKVPLHHAAMRGQKAFDSSLDKEAPPKAAKQKLRVKASSTPEPRAPEAVSALAAAAPARSIEKSQSFGELWQDAGFQAALKQAVEDYCARHFDGLAREVLTAELRRLADEKARHLLDN